MARDEFEDFAAAMAHAAYAARARPEADRVINERKNVYLGARDPGKKPKFTEQQKRDRAVISVMKDWPLKPGQMMLLGPKSVQILSTPNAFAGVLPDLLIIEKDEWCSN